MVESHGKVGRLALLGVGLIGSSLARAVRRGDLASHIAGCTRSEASRDTCLELGIVDSAHLDAAACVRDADLVVLCSHLGSYTDIAKTIAPALKPGAIVTDVGSVKACVLAELRPLLPGGIHLVPGHPVSGAETSGPRAGFAELFDNRWCILTPDADTDQAAVDRVAAFWRAIGSRCSTVVMVYRPGEREVSWFTGNWNIGGLVLANDEGHRVGSSPALTALRPLYVR